MYAPLTSRGMGHTGSLNKPTVCQALYQTGGTLQRVSYCLSAGRSNEVPQAGG